MGVSGVVFFGGGQAVCVCFRPKADVTIKKMFY